MILRTLPPQTCLISTFHTLVFLSVFFLFFLDALCSPGTQGMWTHPCEHITATPWFYNCSMVDGFVTIVVPFSSCKGSAWPTRQWCKCNMYSEAFLSKPVVTSWVSVAHILYWTTWASFLSLCASESIDQRWPQKSTHLNSFNFKNKWETKIRIGFWRLWTLKL